MASGLYAVAQAHLGMQPLHMQKDQSIFAQHDAVTRFYFVKTGEVHLLRNTLDGDTLCMDVRQAGEAVAEASLFSNHYQCTAVAHVDTSLHSVSKPALLTLLEKEPKLMRDLLARFAQQVRTLRLLTEIKNIKSARDRILIFLQHQPEQTYYLQQPLIQLASHIGLARETVYREMKKLANEGCIERDKRKIKLI